MFITIEGVDGSGKTTQSRLTAEYLRANGYDVLLTREPGGTSISDQIRGILLDNMDNTEMHARTELLLFCASRAQLVEQVIVPHLKNNGIVICDRYADSTIAYQGYGHGLNLKELKQVVGYATGGLLPDVTLLLDIPPLKALVRKKNNNDDWNRLDDMELAFHERVYKGYQEMRLSAPARFVEINANQVEDAVQAAIREKLAEWLPIPKGE